LGRFEPFATKRQLPASWQIPKLLPAREPHLFTKDDANHISPDDLGRPLHPPAPLRSAGLPSVTPHDRRCQLRPDAG
jgi:hypothetical protein